MTSFARFYLAARHAGCDEQVAVRYACTRTYRALLNVHEPAVRS